MVLNPEMIDYIEGDESSFEKDTLEGLANAGNLAAYKHTGFWQCMDTQRDKELLEKFISEGDAPWIKW